MPTALSRLVPMGLIAPAIQIYLACSAKTFKEAQSYMAFLVLAAVPPGLLATSYPVGDKPWIKPIPIIGQYGVSVGMLGGKIPSPWVLPVPATGCVLLAILFLALAPRLFSSEEIILAR